MCVVDKIWYIFSYMKQDWFVERLEIIKASGWPTVMNVLFKFVVTAIDGTIIGESHIWMAFEDIRVCDDISMVEAAIAYLKDYIQSDTFNGLSHRDKGIITDMIPHLEQRLKKLKGITIVS